MHMSDPMGDFVLPKLMQTPLIFVAGGIGITPFHSMLSWLADTGEERPIKLLYGVNNEDEIIFQETFDRARQHATIVVSDPSPAWGGERGRLSAELILGLEQPSEDTLVYVSGPEPMVEALEEDLKKAGLKKHQLVLDFFPNYSVI
jgi:ferredoxin-NADP reductase